MGIGAGVAGTLLRGLGWVLFALAAPLIGLTAIRALGWQEIPAEWSDLLGGLAFALCGLAARWLAARFESL